MPELQLNSVSTPDDCAFITSDSGRKILFAEDKGQIAKWVHDGDNIPTATKVVTFGGTSDNDGWVVTLVAKKYQAVFEGFYAGAAVEM